MNFPDLKKFPEDKIYFSIGEVARILDIERSTLRYWEKEFSQLDPSQTPGGQRRYHREDIESILRIRHLLREERFTIEGAQRKLARWETWEQQSPYHSLDRIESFCDEALGRIRDFRRDQL